MTTYTLRTGVKNHPERTVLAHLTDCVRRGGVLSLATNYFQVTEQATPTMGVTVTAGRAYLKATGTNAYPVIMIGDSNLTVTSNPTAMSRLDTVVIYADLNAVVDEEAEGTDVIKLTVIAGTASESPTAPTDTTITTAIGNVPFERLANITVVAAATAITDENITDVRRRAYFKSPRTVVTATSETLTPDYSLSDHYEWTISAAATLNLPAAMELGDWLMVSVIQDATGNRTLTFNSSFIQMSGDLEPNNLPNKVTTYVIEKTAANYRLYLAGREE